MKYSIGLILLFAFSFTQPLQAQTRIDSTQFFLVDTPLNATLTTDITKLITQKNKAPILDGTFTWETPDSSVTQNVTVNARGQFRRGECYMPPLRINFQKNKNAPLSSLNSLKLVNSCRFSSDYEQLILKEYLIYKIYNLLTDKSFRVRLLHLTYKDEKDRKKPVTQYAFLIESINAMAKRNDCKEYKNENFNTERTNRQQMTLVAMFEYMIGNTDWSVPHLHNIRLIRAKADTLSAPFSVPYDFDYAGLVNAPYAVPTPELGIEKVTDRLYRGFPRTMPELEQAISVFNEKKAGIYSLINNCDLLYTKTKREMIDFLDQFYRDINNKRTVQDIFIDNARRS